MSNLSGPLPRSSFIRDAQAAAEKKHRDRARLILLEAALAECVHYIATTYGDEDDLPEPECSIEAKKLLGWKLG